MTSHYYDNLIMSLSLLCSFRQLWALLNCSNSMQNKSDIFTFLTVLMTVCVHCAHASREEKGQKGGGERKGVRL